jgi:UDP-3-O-[3-hydroxymyristoyl] glucosamine N-acyltransferase
MMAGDTLIHDQVVTFPGVIIGRNCMISPLRRIQEDIPSKTRVM